MNAENYSTDLSHLGVHKTRPTTHPQTNFYIYQIPEFTVRIMSHSHPHLALQCSILLQIIVLPPLPTNSHAVSLPSLMSKLQVFVKVKYHIYWTIYKFLNHLMCKTVLLYVLGFKIVKCVTDEVVPLAPFSPKVKWFYCIILHSMAIFRNTYAMLDQNWLYNTMWERDSHKQEDKSDI